MQYVLILICIVRKWRNKDNQLIINDYVLVPYLFKGMDRYQT